jgi:hypothetical protein
MHPARGWHDLHLDLRVSVRLADASIEGCRLVEQDRVTVAIDGLHAQMVASGMARKASKRQCGED